MCFGQVFMSQYVTSVYRNLKWIKGLESGECDMADRTSSEVYIP